MTFSLFKIAVNPSMSSYLDESDTHPRWTPQYAAHGHGPLAAKRGDPLPTPENFGHIIVAPTKDGKINFEYFVRNCPYNILEQMFADIPGFLTDPHHIDFIQNILDGN